MMLRSWFLLAALAVLCLSRPGLTNPVDEERISDGTPRERPDDDLDSDFDRAAVGEEVREGGDETARPASDVPAADADRPNREDEINRETTEMRGSQPLCSSKPTLVHLIELVGSFRERDNDLVTDEELIRNTLGRTLAWKKSERFVGEDETRVARTGVARHALRDLVGDVMPVVEHGLWKIRNHVNTAISQANQVLGDDFMKKIDDLGEAIRGSGLGKGAIVDVMTAMREGDKETQGISDAIQDALDELQEAWESVDERDQQALCQIFTFAESDIEDALNECKAKMIIALRGDMCRAFDRGFPRDFGFMFRQGSCGDSDCDRGVARPMGPR